MLFRSRKKVIDNSLKVTINGSPLDYSTSAKFLGITFDSHLSFKNHTENVISGLSKIKGVIRRVQHFTYGSVLHSIYNSFALPFITYGIELWGSSIKTRVSKISELQLSIIKRFSHTIPPDKKPREFDRLYRSQVCLKMFHYHKCNHGSYFPALVDSLLPNHIVASRQPTETHSSLRVFCTGTRSLPASQMPKV